MIRFFSICLFAMTLAPFFIFNSYAHFDNETEIPAQTPPNGEPTHFICGRGYYPDRSSPFSGLEFYLTTDGLKMRYCTTDGCAGRPEETFVSVNNGGKDFYSTRNRLFLSERLGTRRPMLFIDRSAKEIYFHKAYIDSSINWNAKAFINPPIFASAKCQPYH